MHDALTGLPNRTLVIDRTEHMLFRNQGKDSATAALYLDIDDFKKVNHALGHAAGDQLLVDIAARLTSTLRDADTIGRVGGDEFVVLIDGAATSRSAEVAARRVLDAMAQPFDVTDAPGPLAMSVSIGIATSDLGTAAELLRDADVAMHRAKAAGKRRSVHFTTDMHRTIIRRLELETDLRSAADDNQFRLAYQPIFQLDDLRLVSVEALLRWDHPILGVIEPDEFIPILEQTGQIQDVGRWVLTRACHQMAQWRGQGNHVDMSVNVSARQLDHDEIVDHIRQALRSSGLAATSLIIEVTETALMQNADATASRLRAINDLGVRIAVDDFGTGYSSLAYLQQFPVNCLKIDRRFVDEITTSTQSKALIRTLVQLGHDMGLTTLAEGVETVAQMNHLRQENVKEGQGYLLSRPLDASVLETQILIPARVPEPSRM
jgi:diguanylate cyclase (GGDEF)-like protein